MRRRPARRKANTQAQLLAGKIACSQHKAAPFKVVAVFWFRIAMVCRRQRLRIVITVAGMADHAMRRRVEAIRRATHRTRG